MIFLTTCMISLTEFLTTLLPVQTMTVWRLLSKNNTSRCGSSLVLVWGKLQWWNRHHPKENLTNNTLYEMSIDWGWVKFPATVLRILGSTERIILVKENQGPTADLIHEYCPNIYLKLAWLKKWQLTSNCNLMLSDSNKEETITVVLTCCVPLLTPLLATLGKAMS